MEEAENLSRRSLAQSERDQVDKLSDLTYSDLQRLAISLNLPGNLKWSTLITLVMARRRGDDRMVENILNASRAKRDRRRPAYGGVGRRPAAAAAAMAVAATAMEEGANGSGDEVPSKPKRRRTASRGRGRPPSSANSTSPTAQPSNPASSPPAEHQQPPTAPVMPIMVSSYSQPQDFTLRYREELQRHQQSQLHRLEEEQRQQREHLQEQHKLALAIH